MPSDDFTKSTQPIPVDTRDIAVEHETAKRAYALWESYGRPDGRDLEIWLEAERQFLGTDSAVNASHGAPVAAPTLSDAVHPKAAGTPSASVSSSKKRR